MASATHHAPLDTTPETPTELANSVPWKIVAPARSLLVSDVPMDFTVLLMLQASSLHAQPSVETTTSRTNLQPCASPASADANPVKVLPTASNASPQNHFSSTPTPTHTHASTNARHTISATANPPLSNASDAMPTVSNATQKIIVMNANKATPSSTIHQPSILASLNAPSPTTKHQLYKDTLIVMLARLIVSTVSIRINAPHVKTLIPW
jgi:hypothetical protein